MPATPDASHYDGQDLEALSDLPRYNQWILDHFSAHLRGRVIEVGAGIGNVSVRYVGQCASALLVEPAKNLHEKLVARTSSFPQVETACALLSEVDPALTAQPFDAAMMVNVLEHIDDDAAVLRNLFALLSPGGTLLLFVPALPALYGSLDALVHHCRRYTKSSLENVIKNAGFEVDSCRYFDALGMLPWLVAGKVLKQKAFDARGAKLYDRFGVPVTRAVERRLAPPLGKSLIAIARKP